MAADLSGTHTTARRIPPGQHLVRGRPVSHYGPVPRSRPERWSLRGFGASGLRGFGAMARERFALQG
ncbi:hypothetical protein [Streptomyces sp. NBC_01429]|uniref:hypothetical protein n=1 Tax=Streptomyces sp. NBC_01429 TaxID=2903862 RepID=UPI003FCD5F95